MCNPWQRADFLAAGYEHTPEIDEYIEQLGRMLHEGQEEDADHEVQVVMVAGGWWRLHQCTAIQHTISCIHYTIYTLHNIHTTQYTHHTHTIHTLHHTHTIIYTHYTIHTTPYTHITSYTHYKTPQVATLASDFADFDIGMGPVDNPLEEEEDEGDPHDDEAPKDL